MFKSFTLLAATASLLFSSIATAEMSKKTRKIHEGIVATQGPIYDDPELAAYVTRVGEKVLANSDHAGREYHFFVLDNGQVNAFTPGRGLIYFNRGLLVLLNSEAQLAGVLAHEIGHNTGRHIARQKTQSVVGNVVATAATIATGSNAVGSSIGLSNRARLSGFGREMELEADEYAAQYLYNSNYDPSEMLGVLGVLKDHERFNSKNAGGPAYHGIFVTHPRSDKRLQEVVKKAGTLPPGEAFLGRVEWRDALEGVVVGENFTGNKSRGDERYSNKNLGITFTYPEDWTRTLKGSKIILKDPDETLQLQINTEKTVDKSISSADAIAAKYPDDLSDVEPFDATATKDLGVIGKRPEKRVGLVKVARNTFHFLGLPRDNKLSAEEDAQLVSIIKSFRRVTRKDLPNAATRYISYTRVAPGERFADIAKRSAKFDGGEDYLRLLNGYYPKGEPEPGSYIKIVAKHESPNDK